MKKTKDQQDVTRRQIVRTAVDLIAQQGYEATSMKQIARASGIGDATIYNYFPTKEKLLLAFYSITIGDVLAATVATPEFARFTLQERLQLLADGVLERLLPEREFVAITRTIVGRSPLLMMRDEVTVQQDLKAQVVVFLEHAEATGEIAPCGFKPLIGGLFADYLLALVVYWLNDESDEFSDTTQLVDLTLGVLVLALKSGLLGKLTELGSFLLRSQMHRLMQNGSGLLDMLKLARRGMGS